jgi:L-iditol 2-dehydrogenase
MRRLVWAGAKHFRVETYSEMPAVSKGQVLLRVRAVGVCGTDIHILNGRLHGARPPLVLGHELAGDILEVGLGVTRAKSGDRVTVDSVVGCRKCPLCLRGRRQFCLQGYEFGISRDGGCQDVLVVPEENVYPIPAAVSFEEAAILDMEVYAALRRCGPSPGAAALVIGDGPAGLIACQILRVMGAAKLILSGASADRLAKAESMGLADIFVNATRDRLADIVARETHGGGVDLAADFAGTPQSAADTFQSVMPGGTVLLYGVYEAPLESFDLNRIVLRDLRVFGSLSDRVGWEQVIQFVESGQLRLKPLITHSFPLERGPEAFELVSRRSDGVVKAVIAP